MSRSRSWLFLLAWVGAVSATSNLRADILVSQSVTNTGGSAEHEVDLSFAGNLTSLFSAFINPFTGGSTNVSYSAMSNATTVSFLDAMGGSGIAPSASANVGFDYSGSSDSSESQIGVVNNSADMANPSPIQLPPLTMGINQGAGGGTKYLINFATVTSGGQSVGQWFEVPYTGTSPPQLVPQNYTGGGETLSNVGFMLSNTQIPLDNLNFNDNPPSSFTPVPSYTPSLGGSSDEVINLPEPSGIVLLALGTLGLIGTRLLRRKLRAR